MSSLNLIEHHDLSAYDPVVFHIVNQFIEVLQLSFRDMPKDIVLETVIHALLDVLLSRGQCSHNSTVSKASKTRHTLCSRE